MGRWRAVAAAVVALAGLAGSVPLAAAAASSSSAPAPAPAPVEVLGVPMPAGVTDSVVRLYRGALGREPDAGAVQFWAVRYVEHGSLTGVVREMAATAEYRRRLGSLGDADFVATLFRQALGREPDGAGSRYWVDQIARVGRARVLVTLTESAEAVRHTGTATPVAPPWRPVSWEVGRGVSDSVLRLYVGMFGRLPDPSGFPYWMDRYITGRSLGAVAAGMAAGGEFGSAFPAHEGDGAFVTRAYRRVLRRDPDQAGHAHWAWLLGTGQVTRPGLIAALTESGELVRRTGTAAPAPPPAVVYLTFDDGPSATGTYPVLDVLARHGARATFFVVGQELARRPAMVAEIARRGHGVQNHTWGHVFLTRVGDAAVRDQLVSTSHAIESVTGRRPTCMRPPGGAVDGRVVQLAAGMGLGTAMWHIDTADYRQRPAGVMVDHVLANVRHGSVVLFHDGPVYRANTVAAVDALLPALRQRGFVTRPMC